MILLMTMMMMMHTEINVSGTADGGKQIEKSDDADEKTLS
jgi:hypothetical protein